MIFQIIIILNYKFFNNRDISQYLKYQEYKDAFQIIQNEMNTHPDSDVYTIISNRDSLKNSNFAKNVNNSLSVFAVTAMVESVFSYFKNIKRPNSSDQVVYARVSMALNVRSTGLEVSRYLQKDLFADYKTNCNKN